MNLGCFLPHAPTTSRGLWSPVSRPRPQTALLPWRQEDTPTRRTQRCLPNPPPPHNVTSAHSASGCFRQFGSFPKTTVTQSDVFCSSFLSPQIFFMCLTEVCSTAAGDCDQDCVSRKSRWIFATPLFNLTQHHHSELVWQQLFLNSEVLSLHSTPSILYYMAAVCICVCNVHNPGEKFPHRLEHKDVSLNISSCLTCNKT